MIRETRTDMTVTYGVIGCGMMGREHLQNIALLEGARVGAIFEPDAGMAAAASALAPATISSLGTWGALFNFKPTDDSVTQRSAAPDCSRIVLWEARRTEAGSAVPPLP